MKQKYDIIVVGAGFAGVAAAIRAARNGRDVLLLDQGGCPGGTAAACMVIPFMNFWTTDPETGEKIYLCKGIFSEIVQGLEDFGAFARNRVFNEEYLKVVMNRLLLDAGVTLLYQSYLIDAAVENQRITAVTVANKSGKMTFTADCFIDATGDADLAVLAGCPTNLGRDSDHLCQPMTLSFRMCNVDLSLFKEQKPAIQEAYKAAQARGEIKNPRENVLTFLPPVDGVVHFNTTRVVKRSPVDAFDITAAEIEAREQVIEMIDFLRRNFSAFEKAELISTAARIGVRESRMIDGEYRLTQEDLKACARFDDTIAVGNYDIDIHSPDGSGTSHYYFAPGDYYTIPYRCLLPKGIRNLLVAGRCISTTHEAQASIRIMPICCCLGEAAGTAAAMAVDGEVRKLDIPALQSTLEKQGLVIR